MVLRHTSKTVLPLVERVVCQALGDTLNDPSVGAQARRTGTDPRTRSPGSTPRHAYAARSAVAVCGCRCCGRAADCWHRARLAVRRPAPAPSAPQVAAGCAPRQIGLPARACDSATDAGDLLWRGWKPAPSAISPRVRGLAQEGFRGGRTPAADAGPPSAAKQAAQFSGRDRVVPPARSAQRR